MSYEKYIPADLLALYEVYDYRHAAAILATEFPEEFAELCAALSRFRFTDEQVMARGGSETEIPKTFSALLRPRWKEEQLTAKLIVGDETKEVSTHKVDYIRGRVAFDLEWNSKDQTFDRDLTAFRAFHEWDKISVGVLATRSKELRPWFKSLGTYVEKDRKGDDRTKRYSDKYAASHTDLPQLLRRLVAGRHGECPVLVFGITTRLVLTRSSVYGRLLTVLKNPSQNLVSLINTVSPQGS